MSAWHRCGSIDGPHEHAMAESPTEIVYRKQRPLLVLRSAVLRVIAGPDEGGGCILGQERVSVGAAPDNTLVLTNPAPAVKE